MLVLVGVCHQHYWLVLLHGTPPSPLYRAHATGCYELCRWTLSHMLNWQVLHCFSHHARETLCIKM